jgi:hypothetical protein
MTVINVSVSECVFFHSETLNFGCCVSVSWLFFLGSETLK